MIEMKAATKTWLSVAGVCFATAAVIGGALAAATHSDSGGGQRPAGNEIAVTAPATASATSSASTSPVVAAKVSPSTKKAQAPNRRPAVLNNQQGDPPVTETTSAAVEPKQPPNVDLGTGTLDEGGVRRAPAPSEQVRHPAPPAVTPHPLPSNSAGQGD